MVAMIAGVDAGWLDLATFGPVIKKAWGGLSTAIDSDGLVHHICDGFGEFYPNPCRNPIDSYTGNLTLKLHLLLPESNPEPN
jgi:hypothetical protein